MNIGIDMASISQIARLAARPRFGALVFTPAELAPVESETPRRREEYLAGRFAAKEAVAKVLGTGFVSGVWWRDIEIVPGPRGAPVVRLHRRARTLAVGPVVVSITHQAPWAVAVAAMTGGETLQARC